MMVDWDSLKTKLGILLILVEIVGASVWLLAGYAGYAVMSDGTALSTWREVAHELAVAIGDVQITVSNQTTVYIQDGEVYAPSPSINVDNRTVVSVEQPYPAGWFNDTS